MIWKEQVKNMAANNLQAQIILINKLFGLVA